MILVTGGAGFIGSNLVAGLNAAGHERIVIVDDLTDGNKVHNLNGLRFADYIDRDELLQVLPRLDGVEGVFHQGACADTMEPDGRFVMRVNYAYSRSLLDWALARRIPFVYASSAAVYGDGQRGFVEDPRCESALNVYAFSKLAFDNLVRQRLPQAQSQVAGLRYFNVYGPRERHKGKMRSIICQLFDQAQESGTLHLFEGTGACRRDFVHVDDCVSANLHLFEVGQSGVFNCGTGQARTFSEVAELAIQLLGSGKVEFVPFPEQLRGRYQASTKSDPTRLRSTGYRHAFLTLEQGMTSYYDVLLEQARRSETGGLG